jgi:colanic acid/amylovoran biosynthesis glycosyltransferase
MREIRALGRQGVDVQIISVWQPKPIETTAYILAEWAKQTHFLLPSSFSIILRVVFSAAMGSPSKSLAAVRLAFRTSRPGLKGLAYQLFYLVEAMLAAETLKKAGVSHVHNHFGDHSGMITMLAAKLSGISYSISFHGPHVFFDGKYAGIGEKVRYASFVRCISHFCRSQVMLLSGCEDPSAFKVIHCGLDVSRYHFRLPRERVARIFCAARLAPEKGLDFLIRALKILVDKQYNIEMRIAGDGPNRAALQALAQTCGVAPHLHLLGTLSEQEVTRELDTSDIFVLPSLAEGLPISAMEALAVGVPVVATNIAGTSELIEHGKTGLLVRPTDPEALADAVIQMIRDFGLRKQIAELGRKKVLDEFDVDKETMKLRTCLLQH